MKKHNLTLLGGPHDELRVSAALLHDALGALLDGARLATRFSVEGESARTGPTPGWLSAACSVDVTGLKAGSAVLTMEAATLDEAYPEKFGEDTQPDLFLVKDEPLATHTAIDLFGGVLLNAITGDRDDVVADRALLDACIRFAKVAGSSGEGIRIDGLHADVSSVVVTKAHIPHLELLRDQTPSPQAVRVAGTLETISASRPEIALKLKDGTRVPARTEEHDPETLRVLFGRKVVVSGIAHFRPSGRVLKLDVELIEESTAGDALFESAPVARELRPVAAELAQDESSGVAAIFGTWPGDESEEELLEAAFYAQQSVV